MKKYYRIIGVLLVILIITGCTAPWYKQTIEEAVVPEETVLVVETTAPKETVEVPVTETTRDETAADDTTATVDEELVIEEESTEAVSETTEASSEEELQAQKAKDLNTLGFEKYEEGAYEAALALFEASMAEDDNYFYAHYNYACTIGVLMKEDYPMWFDRREEVYGHLRKVLELNPDYLAKFKTDKDLDLLRSDYQYYELLGYSMDHPEDTQMFFENLNWYIQGPGIYTVIGGLEVQDNNRFKLRHLDYNQMEDPDFTSNPIEFEGSYTISQGVVYFTLDESMPKGIIPPLNGEDGEMLLEFQGVLMPGGQLQLNNLNYKLYSWYDEFSA